MHAVGGDAKAVKDIGAAKYSERLRQILRQAHEATVRGIGGITCWRRGRPSRSAAAVDAVLPHSLSTAT